MLNELLIAGAANLILWLWVLIVPTIVIPRRRLHLGALGLAIPGVVVVVDPESAHVLRHELAHQDQFRRYSPLVLAAALGVWYGAAAVTTRWTTGSWPSFRELWRRNPIELDAEARAVRARGQPLPKLIRLGAARRAAPGS